jgi:hypothetical protein
MLLRSVLRLLITVWQCYCSLTALTSSLNFSAMPWNDSWLTTHLLANLLTALATHSSVLHCTELVSHKNLTITFIHVTLLEVSSDFLGNLSRAASWTIRTSSEAHTTLLLSLPLYTLFLLPHSLNRGFCY